MHGGVGRVVENLVATGIDGFEQKVSVLDPGGFPSARAAIEKTITAKRAIEALPADSVAHLHCGFRSWLYMRPNRDVRYIATVHGILPPKGLAVLSNKVELLLLSKHRVSIVAVSEHCKKTMEDMAGLRRPITVIPNGVPGTSVSLPTENGRMVRIGFVGDFSANKGIHTFLEVARLLKRMPAKFIVFGKGRESGLIEEAVHEGLIRWINGETRPEEIYTQMDILLFPSWFEGCPMTVLEAMSHGVAIISSDIPGVREIIEHGEDGVLVGSWAARDYAVAVERLIAPDEKRVAISKRAKEKWATHFNADLMAKRYCQLAANHW